MSAPIPEDLRELHYNCVHWSHDTPLNPGAICKLIERIAAIEAQVKRLREALLRPIQTHEAEERGLYECDDPELIEQIQGIYANRAALAATEPKP